MKLSPKLGLEVLADPGRLLLLSILVSLAPVPVRAKPVPSFKDPFSFLSQKKAMQNAAMRKDWKKYASIVETLGKTDASRFPYVDFSQDPFFFLARGTGEFQTGAYAAAAGSLEKALGLLGFGALEFKQVKAQYLTVLKRVEYASEEEKKARIAAAERFVHPSIEEPVAAFRAGKSQIQEMLENSREKRDFDPRLRFVDALGQTFVRVPVTVPDAEDAVVDAKYRETGPGVWMSAYELTQRQWRAFLGANGSAWSADGLDLPEENITWHDARRFADTLTRRFREMGLLPEGYAYQLPSVAQWRAAALAGAETIAPEAIGKLAWTRENSGRKTHPVGKKEPNAWGLHDLLGNVSEWCADWYQKDHESRVHLGGSYASKGTLPEALEPSKYNKDKYKGTLGFRLVLVPTR